MSNWIVLIDLGNVDVEERSEYDDLVGIKKGSNLSHEAPQMTLNSLHPTTQGLHGPALGGKKSYNQKNSSSSSPGISCADVLRVERLGCRQHDEGTLNRSGIEPGLATLGR